AGRGSGRRTGTLGRPGPGARGPGRGGRVPRTRGGADPGAGAAGRTCAGRGPGEDPSRRIRGGGEAARHRRGRTARRTAACSRRSPTGPARVRGKPGQRRPATAAESRPTTRVG